MVHPWPIPVFIRKPGLVDIGVAVKVLICGVVIDDFDVELGTGGLSSGAVTLGRGVEGWNWARFGRRRLRWW